MKLNKFFLMSFAATLMLGLVSCSSDDSFSPGPEVGTTEVSFVDDENVTLELTDTQFGVTVQRSNANGELTVPLIVIASPELTVPESVTFANGSTTAVITVKVSEEAKAFVDYKLDITIPAEYAGSTYKANQTTYPHLTIVAHKEDYKIWGKMTYTSWKFGESWDAEVYYSEYLDLYRSDIFTDGYPFYFRINEDGTLEITDNHGSKQQDTVIGYVHPSYGMMFVRWLSDNFTGYSGGAYYLPLQYRVSAGSFGADYDSFILTPAN